MVKIIVKRCQKEISEIVIQGHAGYGEKGEDLICAGVSSIAIGALNALDLNGNNICDPKIKDAYIRIAVQRPSDHDTQIMLDMLRIQLVTMQESYPNYIKVIDQEV